MNDLPPGWEWATVGSVAESLVDGPFGSNLKTEHYQSSGVRVIRLQNIADGSFDETDKAYISENHANNLSRHEARPGDVLIAAMGDVLPRVCLVPSNIGRAIVKADCFRLRPHAGALPEYVAYMLSAPQTRKRASTQIAGIGRPRLNLKKVSSLELPIPPREEQERIVVAIKEQFSRLDAGVQALEGVQQNLRLLRAAVLEAAVPSAGQTTAKVALGDLVAPGRKIAYGVLVPGDHVPAGVPLVRVGDLSNRQVNTQGLKHIAPSIAARYPRTRLQGGEVLLSLVGTIGRTAVVPPELAGANAARALAVIPVRETVEPGYVAIALSRDRVTRELTNLSHEVARKTLNLEDVRGYEIPLPSYPVQLEIVKAVETEEAWIKAAEEAVARTFRRADHLRSSILQTAFAGSLVPQDSTDEPASVLLQRIGAERVGSTGHRPKLGRKPRVLQEEVTA